MFICAHCTQAIGPKVSPVVVTTLTRTKEYKNTVKFLDDYEREHTKIVESQGFETAREIKVCPPCFGEELPAARVVPLKRVVHEEPLAPPLRPMLLAVAIDNAIERYKEIEFSKERERKGSRRAEQETKQVIPQLKSFIDSQDKNFRF